MEGHTGKLYSHIVRMEGNKITELIAKYKEKMKRCRRGSLV